MDFIDKKDVLGLEVGQDSGQVTGALNGGTRGRFDVDPRLSGDDVGEAGLAQPRRSVEKDMIDRFAAAPGGSDGYLEVFLGIVLPDEVGQGTGPEAVVQGCVFFTGLAGYNARYGLTPVLERNKI
jgi:hypothetical protein